MERENKTVDSLLIAYRVDVAEIVDYFKQLKEDNNAPTYGKIADALEIAADCLPEDGARREFAKLFEGYFSANDMIIALNEAERFEDDMRTIYENAYRGALTHIFGAVEMAAEIDLTPEERRTFHRMIDTAPAALLDDSPFKGATVFIA